MRNNVISICKGIAIILMVLGHTEGPGFLMHIVYLFHMPIFFITAGYFFSRKYLSDSWTFVVKRFKGLYVPMVKWALFFLVIHNLMFKIGLLSEQYGNWENGVTHPYDLHAFLQRAVSIVTSMSGYDEFLAGAFWFFRALLISSILFMALYYALDGRWKLLRGNGGIAAGRGHLGTDGKMDHGIAVVHQRAEKVQQLGQIRSGRLRQLTLLVVMVIDHIRRDVHAVCIGFFAQRDLQRQYFDAVSGNQLLTQVGGTVAGNDDFFLHMVVPFCFTASLDYSAPLAKIQQRILPKHVKHGNTLAMPGKSEYNKHKCR